MHSIHSTGSRRFSAQSRGSDVDLRRDLSSASKSSLLLVSKGVSTAEFDDEGLGRPEWALDQIELSDSDSDLEFFDAKGKVFYVSVPPSLPPSDTVGEEDSLDETINEEEDEEDDKYPLTPVKENVNRLSSVSPRDQEKLLAELSKYWVRGLFWR